LIRGWLIEAAVEELCGYLVECFRQVHILELYITLTLVLVSSRLRIVSLNGMCDIGISSCGMCQFVQFMLDLLVCIYFRLEDESYGGISVYYVLEGRKCCGRF